MWWSCTICSNLNIDSIIFSTRMNTSSNYCYKPWLHGGRDVHYVTDWEAWGAKSINPKAVKVYKKKCMWDTKIQWNWLLEGWNTSEKYSWKHLTLKSPNSIIFSKMFLYLQIPSKWGEWNSHIRWLMNKCKTRVSMVGMKICNYKCKTYHTWIINFP